LLGSPKQERRKKKEKDALLLRSKEFTSDSPVKKHPAGISRIGIVSGYPNPGHPKAKPEPEKRKERKLRRMPFFPSLLPSFPIPAIPDTKKPTFTLPVLRRKLHMYPERHSWLQPW